METKICSRCGQSKTIAEFRNYYGAGQTGTYRFCKECERIESRRKYLTRLGDKMSGTQRQSLEAINKLYAQRAAQGLSVPCSRSRSTNDIDSIVAKQLEEGAL